MAEGVAVGGQVLSAGVHDDPQHQPDPSSEAPRGWTWNRADRRWKPKIRGPVLWQGDGGAVADHDDPAVGGAPDGPGPARSPDEGRDPAPAWMRDDNSTGGGGGPRQLTQDDVERAGKDIAGLMGLVATPILAVLQQADPYCGGALAQSFEPAVDATLPLICRSERIVRYFTEDTADWLLWGKLAIVLAQPAKAVVEHHLLHKVETTTDELGRRTWRHVEASGDGGDHLQPQAQPEPGSYRYAA